jgi:hypothetical protein
MVQANTGVLEEYGLFFGDHPDHVVQDDVIARVMTFYNVLIKNHQAFLIPPFTTWIVSPPGKLSGNEIYPE